MILAPTRELVEQIYSETIKLMPQVGLSVNATSSNVTYGNAAPPKTPAPFLKAPTHRSTPTTTTSTTSSAMSDLKIKLQQQKQQLQIKQQQAVQQQQMQQLQQQHASEMQRLQVFFFVFVSFVI